MRPYWPFFAVVVNAVALLVFRSVPSLDGPLYIANAHLLLQKWTGVLVGADGLYHDPRFIAMQALHVPAMVLLQFVSPALTYQIISSVLILLLGWSCIDLIRAYGHDVGPAALVLLPLSYGIFLLLGFVDFQLVVAVALFAIAWWVRSESTGERRPLVLLLWGIALFLIHRGGVFLFAALIIAHELPVRGLGLLRTRRGRITGSILVVLGIAAVWFVLSMLTLGQVGSGGEREPITDLFRLRPLLLLDSDAELPFRVIWGVIFLSLLILAAKERIRSGVLAKQDGSLVAAVFLLIASVVVRGFSAEVLYFCERVQWIALLLLCLWAASTAPNGRVVVAIGCVALVLHFGRLVYLEKRLAPYADRHAQLTEASQYIDPDAVLVPVRCDPDWLATHSAAWLITEHKGYILSKNDRFRFMTGNPALERFRIVVNRELERMQWLEPHVANKRAPKRLQVILIGDRDAIPEVDQHCLNVALDSYFEVKHRNGYVTLYDLKEKDPAPRLQTAGIQRP